MSRQSQRGSAILVTMIVVVALLGGGAVLLGMQMQSTRSTETSRTGMSALYCAEAGLNAARTLVGTSYAQWNGSLCNPGAPRSTGPCVPNDLSTANLITLAGFEPTWLNHPTVNHDLDGDGDNDFIITLLDNEDEPSTTNDYLRDNDLRVYLISTCIAFPEYPKQVTELVEFNAGTNCIKTQKGGCRGMGGGN